MALLPVPGGSDALATPGGRVTFQPLTRTLDTRNNGPAVTEVQLPSNTMMELSILRAGSDANQTLITAAVHPCATPVAPGVASFILRSDEFVASGKVITQSATTCVTASSPVHVVIDKIGAVSDTPASSSLQYVAIAPTAVLDRVVGADATTVLPAAPGVPSGAKGLVLLLDASDAERGGYLRAFDCARPRPENADLSYSLSRVSNLSYVTLVPGGAACMYSLWPVSVKATVLGYFTDDGPNPASLPPSLDFVTGDVAPPGLRAITPVRVLDTRNGIGRPGSSKVAAKQTVQLGFGSQVASTTASVVLNVTAVAPDATGFVTAYPCDRPRPTTSNLNFTAGDTVPNLVVVKLGVDRTVCLYTEATTHLLADLTGTFENEGGARGKAVVPTRILDTRTAIGVPAAGKMPAGQVLTLQVAGRGNVPATGATAATLNVTAADPNEGGYLTVWPCDRPQPTASSLNFTTGDVVPNLVTTRLSPTGTVCMVSTAATHLLADVGMWFGNLETAGFKELVPDRLLDTRTGIGVLVPGKVAALVVVHLQVAGRGGVPVTGVTAVALNMTAVAADDGGYVTAWPCDQPLPVVSNLNFGADQTIPNAATVKLAADGTVCLFTTATTHLLADVAGYYTGDPDTGFVPTLT